ncbi:hypothetical protein E4U39_004892, partial [Claviceps sp. Clav50 group G5]
TMVKRTRASTRTPNNLLQTLTKQRSPPQLRMGTTSQCRRGNEVDHENTLYRPETQLSCKTLTGT